jgi:hypothetical protein
VLDPSVEQGYASWNLSSWNNWLENRITSDYGTKSVNSVIVKRPGEILNDFKFSNPSVSKR